MLTRWSTRCNKSWQKRSQVHLFIANLQSNLQYHLFQQSTRQIFAQQFFMYSSNGKQQAPSSPVMPPTPTSTTTTTTMQRSIPLKKQEEFRFEVDHKDTVELQLVQGTAEIFGTELAPNVVYKFSGVKLAVFSWHGATIKLEGPTQSEYTAQETPMEEYILLHQKYEQARNSIAAEGPKVLIVGPTDSGKSTLCRILTAYATRLGHKIAYADLDVGQQGISVPGTMAMAQLTAPADLHEGFSNLSPLAFYYGHADVSENSVLYKKLCDRMAECFELKSQQDAKLKSGGIIINTCGYVDGIGYQLLLHAAKTFKVTNILVIGDDRLTANLKRDLPQVPTERINKSGGVVIRSTHHRRKTRMNKIREYFYGLNDTLSPHSIVVKFEDVCFLKIGGHVAAPKSALPIGAKSSIDPVEMNEVEPTDASLVHGVLGLSQANKKEDVLLSNIAGLVYLEKVDTEKKEFTMLVPLPGKLPKKYLIVGSIKWLQ